MVGKISVVINTFNEEKNIERAIKSVRWADEIIVCDMHSTDKTVEIAKKLGVNPADCVYIGDNPLKDFEGARKAGFKTIRVLTGPYKDIKVEKDADLVVGSILGIKFPFL